ncbi:karyopherin [Martiniozyma asiatica (nom. inval.)]|nr:karyopherin [Martiniozyma asiatica]
MSEGLSRIIAALDAIYNSSSSNDDRKGAQLILDEARDDPQAPFFGYQMALPNNINLEPSKVNVVRHFALNLLLNAIVKHYHSWETEKKLAVRNWIIELATKITENDPHYIKEKIAYLWVEITKRCWGKCLMDQMILNPNEPLKAEMFDVAQKEESWCQMDSNLLELYNHSSITRELVLIIQRALFEDIYLLDDPEVSKRKLILNTLCSEVVLSLEVLTEKFDPCDAYRLFAGGDKGWLSIWGSLMDECFTCLFNNPTNSQEYQNCISTTIKLLDLLRVSLFWVIPLAIQKSGIVSKLLQALAFDNTKARLLIIDCLNGLANRYIDLMDEQPWFCSQIFCNETYSLLFKVFNSIKSDLDDTDDDEYILCTKLSEFIVNIAEYILAPEINLRDKTSGDFTNFYKLVLETTTHESLSISNISLNLWVQFLREDDISDLPDFEVILPDLLETSASRLLNYAEFDPDSKVLQLLENEFDNSTDRTSFLNNYKKSNDDILRIIICKKPSDGLIWLADRLNTFYDSQMGRESLNSFNLKYKGEGSETYHNSFVQFVIIEACVRGITRWQIWYKEPDADEKKQFLIEQVDNLCQTLMSLNFNDPNLLRKKIQTLVQFTPLLKGTSGTMFKVLEMVIESCTFPFPENAEDEILENIRDLRACSGTELNRLAYLMPETLKDILPQLEEVIDTLLASGKVSAHERVAFKSFLLVVSQRSTIDSKEQRFERIVDPELDAWTNPQTIEALSNLHWFMERLGIAKIREYFLSRGITAQTDLLNTEMDDEGRILKKELKEKWTSAFPIRATRVFIQYSIEKLPHDSENYKYLLKLWKPRVQRYLEYILRLLYQVQAYHNPANWVDLPVEVQSFVKYTTQERFWQQGISIQSKESFVDDNVKAMKSLRDFADSVGHIVRYTREYGYMVLQSVTELEETLYEMPGAASMLWKALTDEHIGISLHSWRHMTNMVVRSIIKNCPVKYVPIWMPEFLPLVLNTLDKLLIEKWTLINARLEQTEGPKTDEELSEEMLEEHMLRQLTQVVVRMLIDLVGQGVKASLNERQIKTREIICHDFNILAPLLKLMSDIIGFRDTRCTFNTILILRNMSNELLNLSPDVDQYIIQSLFPTLIRVLDDNFYADAHSEAGYTLTILYSGERTKSNMTHGDLSQLMLQNTLNITRSEVDDFEDALRGCTRTKEKRNVFISLISRARAKANGLRGDTTGDEYVKNRERLLIASRTKKKDNVDGLDGGLGGLFGEN